LEEEERFQVLLFHHTIKIFQNSPQSHV
jgi:hypothetical protein